MATITASDVNKLRQQTGLGMMDCKNALVEAEGDFSVAVEILRKKGQKVAAKRGDNEAKEGLTVAKTAGNKGVILTLNCETDFVAKNEEYSTFTNALVDLALAKGCTTTEELLATSFDGTLTVAERITEQIGKTGEKMEVSAYALVEGETVIAYNHPGNQVASIVALNQAGDAVESAGKDVAMQIAAMAPVALDKDDVSAETISKEIEIGKEIARNEGKPEEMLEKIAMGKLNKFYKEMTLLNQEFIKDNKKDVSTYLDSVSKGLTAVAFRRFAVK